MSPLFKLVLLLVLGLGAVVAEEELPTVKLSPQIRTLEPNATNYDDVPCDQLYAVAPRNDADAQALQQRKQQCLKSIRAFTSSPVPHGATQ